MRRKKHGPNCATTKSFDLSVDTIMEFKMASCFYRICIRNRGFLVAFLQAHDFCTPRIALFLNDFLADINEC